MKFYSLTKKYCAILVLLAFSTFGWSQGIVYTYRNIFVGQSLTEPTGMSTAVDVAPKKGTISIGNNNFTYTPTSAYRGLDTFGVHYRVQSGPILTWKYNTYIVKSDFSYLTIGQDYASTTKNTPVTINVLANDSAMGANGAIGLDVTNISLVNNGANAIINANNQIVFTPTQDYTGVAYINYVVCDNAGYNCATGSVSIVVNEASLSSYTFTRLNTSKNTPVSILLPNSNFGISANGTKGTTTLISGNAYKYTPNLNFVGKDTVTFTTNTNTVKVEVEVLNKATGNLFAVDDYTYTPINQAITVNVLANDKITNPVLSSFTQPNAAQGTVALVNGKFLFTPAANFTGIAKFTYLLKNSTAIPSQNNVNEWATVYVVVSNQYPAKSVFNLTTPINTPLVLNYKIPITGFNFSVLDSTQNGSLDYHSGFTTLNFANQGSISGYNLMVYTPSSGFIGNEEFELLYCINGNCRSVKFIVEVQAVTPTLPSYCVGDCVWAGDSNNDGIVDMTDILPIGYCQGEAGLARANASNNWFGQFGNNWNNPFMPGQDLKYIDTNGDGDVSAADTTALMNNYLKAHNIVAEKTPNYKALPFSWNILTPNPQIGDYVEVDILLGKVNTPVTDLSGFTMEFNYDDQVINAQSLQCTYYANSWMTHNSPTLRAVKKPTDGRFDLGYVRTGGSAASGYGKVAKLGFIIEDELNGIRDNDGQYTVELVMQGGSTVGSDGIIYDLPQQKISIPIHAKSKVAFDAASVVAYPNPANDVLNLYLNGGYEMERYEVYNLAGQVVLQNNASGRSTQIGLQELNSGIYFVKVISNGGVTTKKFEVIK